jgi:N-methylhydantoinase A
VQGAARGRFAICRAELRLAGRAAGGRLSPASLKRLAEAFIQAYRRRYHRLNPNVPVELVSWRVCVTGPRPEIRIAPPKRSARVARKGVRPVYFPEAENYVSCPVYDRFALGPGHRLRGPAVIEEPESTAVIGPGASAAIDGDGNLIVVLPAARARSRERVAA